MALTLELAQTVAIGPFNAYIITPEWLVKQQVLPEDEVSIRLLAVSDGAAFKFKELEWQVDARRLIVTARKGDWDCGALVARVLDLLHHTPVRAVGHNFHFAGSWEDWGASPQPMLGTKGYKDFEQTEQMRWVGVFQRQGVRIEVAVVCAEEGVVVLFNHHRNTKDPVEATAAARQFQQDRQVSEELLRTLVGQEVKHD